MSFLASALPDILTISWLGMPVWIWLCFLALVMTILAIDLGLLQKEAHAPSFKESALLAGACMTLGASFSAVVWYLYYIGAPTNYMDPTLANAASDTSRAWTAWQLYLTAWAIEQSLSFDNVFVMSLIFTYFTIPREYQHRVLFYGILGVVVLRAVMIGLGAALIQEFSWILYIFAVFLIFTGVKMLVSGDNDFDVESNPILKYMRGHMRITKDLHGQRFFIKASRKDEHSTEGKLVRWATPLFVALIMIELADVVFAVDSVPAVFSITQEAFIVYTSNIFAILGLRALYFVLSAMVNRFEYLQYALAIVLIFVGVKVLIEDFYHIPALASLIVTVSILLGGILFSLWRTRNATAAEAGSTGSN